ISNWTFSPPVRRSKSSDGVSPLRWKKYSFPSSAAMKPKPRSETTFLMVPVVMATSTPLEPWATDVRPVRKDTATLSAATLAGPPFYCVGTRCPSPARRLARAARTIRAEPEHDGNAGAASLHRMRGGSPGSVRPSTGVRALLDNGQLRRLEL